MRRLTDIDKIEKMRDLYRLYGGEWDKFNLFGIRDESNPNTWNDTLGYATDSEICLFIGTTDPGRNATEQRHDGANHLAEGWWPRLWEIENRKRFGMDVFVQVGNVECWDDKNRNYIHDPSDPISSWGKEGGIFAHSTRKHDLTYVDNSSWACQVWRDYREFTIVIRKAKASGQKLFGYLLMIRKSHNEEFYYAKKKEKK